MEKTSVKITVLVRYRAVQVTPIPLDSSNLINQHIGVKVSYSQVWDLEKERRMVMLKKIGPFCLNFYYTTFYTFFWSIIYFLLLETGSCTMIWDKPMMRSPFSQIFSRRWYIGCSLRNSLIKKIFLFLCLAVCSPPTLIAKAESRSDTYQSVHTLEFYLFS